MVIRNTQSFLLLALVGCSSGGSSGHPAPADLTAAATPDLTAAATPDLTSRATPDLSAAADGGALAPGCAGASLLQRSPDPAKTGPWPVGARTVTIGRLTAEVFYPAQVGSAQGKTPVVYDIRQHLPSSQQGKISDSQNPWQPCDCYRDLPVDTQHGPYPLVLFIHGTAGFRTQSLSHMTHFASRGFVVIAADHPGLVLSDVLSPFCPGTVAGKLDLAGDVTAELGAFSQSGSSVAFVSGDTDLARIGFVGHSAGGAAVAQLANCPGVAAVVPWAGGNTAVAKGPDFRSSLFMGGQSDKVVPFSADQKGYAASAAPKQLVGINDAGHLVFTELCSLKNQAGQDLVTVAKQVGICGANLAGLLFDCSSGYIPDTVGAQLIDHATSTVLEGVLQCTLPIPAGLSGLDGLQAAFKDVSVLQEQLD